MTDAADAVDRVFRTEFGRAVALVTRVLGDIDLAADAVQDAYATAVVRWPVDGVPDNPRAWIVTVARNRAIDRLRRRRALYEHTEELARRAEVEMAPYDNAEDDAIPDERLRLMFTCCHPALAPEAQVALTLRLVAGLTVPEIARARRRESCSSISASRPTASASSGISVVSTRPSLIASAAMSSRRSSSPVVAT